jgi:hypothetical protein
VGSDNCHLERVSVAVAPRSLPYNVVLRVLVLLPSLVVLAQGCGGLTSEGVSLTSISDAGASDGVLGAQPRGASTASPQMDDACRTLCSRYPAEQCAETLIHDDCIERCVTQLQKLTPSCELLGLELVQCMGTYLDPTAHCTPGYDGCSGYGCPLGVLNGCSEFISGFANCGLLPWPLPSECELSGNADVSACDLRMTCGNEAYAARCTYPSTQFEPYAVYSDCKCARDSIWVGPNGTNSDANSACLYMMKACGAPL